VTFSASSHVVQATNIYFYERIFAVISF